MGVDSSRFWGDGSSRLWGMDLVPVGSRAAREASGLEQQGITAPWKGLGGKGAQNPASSPSMGRASSPVPAAGPGCPLLCPGIRAGTPIPCGQSHLKGTVGQMSPVLSALVACVPCSCHAARVLSCPCVLCVKIAIFTCSLIFPLSPPFSFAHVSRKKSKSRQ